MRRSCILILIQPVPSHAGTRRLARFGVLGAIRQGPPLYAHSALLPFRPRPPESCCSWPKASWVAAIDAMLPTPIVTLTLGIANGSGAAIGPERRGGGGGRGQLLILAKGGRLAKVRERLSWIAGERSHARQWWKCCLPSGLLHTQPSPTQTKAGRAKRKRTWLLVLVSLPPPLPTQANHPLQASCRSHACMRILMACGLHPA